MTFPLASRHSWPRWPDIDTSTGRRIRRACDSTNSRVVSALQWRLASTSCPGGIHEDARAPRPQDARRQAPQHSPCLLPRFGGPGMYGDRVFEAVLEAGEAESGVSIHLVEAEYDTGAIVRQCRVPVLQSDSLADLKARVQAREKEFVVETLARIANGDIRLHRRTSA